MDHEFSSSQLGAGQVGWDWLSLQLFDGRELMAYRLRFQDGSTDPFSTSTGTSNKWWSPVEWNSLHPAASQSPLCNFSTRRSGRKYIKAGNIISAIEAHTFTQASGMEAR